MISPEMCRRAWSAKYGPRLGEVIRLRRRQPCPDRRVIRGAVQLARLLVDADGFEEIGGLGREHQMIDAQAFVARPAHRLVVPEGVVPPARIERAQGVQLRGVCE